ncbi:MAG: hypothetical protein JXR73_05835 [Candidatus Omnitrophica bacterium]|nr:hypothetical protein [Candidatus Omnitrophota bacterium]
MVIDVPGEVLMQRLQEFEKLWRKFMEYFNEALNTEEIPKEHEAEFRTLQVEITRRAQFLTHTIPNSIFDLWKDIKKLISETPSLGILKKEAPIRISSFRTMWHDVSIALNQKQGQLRNVLEEQEVKKSKRR